MTRFLTLFAISLVFLTAQTGGRYSGVWSSDGGVNSGKVNITLNPAGESELTFTFQDQLVKPKKVTGKTSANQVEFICELDLEGLRLKTAFQGTIEGNAITGKYQSSSVDDGSTLDTGTWKVTQQ